MAFSHLPRSPASSPDAFGRPGHPAGSPGKQTLTQALEAAAQSPGQPVPPAVRARVEAASDVDLSGVRVHDGPASARAASAISARAYTDGQDVHFAAGQHRPGTPEGDHLLAHELAHTIQGRGAGGGDAVHGKHDVSDPGDAHELEADAFADAIMQGGPAPALGQAGGVARTIHRDAAPPPKFVLIARVPPGVRLTDCVTDPVTDALTREIWVSVGADPERFYVSCPADGTPHFLDAKGLPLVTAQSFGRGEYDLLVKDPHVQQVAGAGADAQAEACAAALRAAFDQRNDQEILRQLNFGPATVRGAVRYYDTRLNNLGGQGLVNDIKQQFSWIYAQAILELRTAGVAVNDDTGVDLAQDPTGASRDQNAHNALASGRIVASPASAVVTPGTTITYSLQLPDMLTPQDYTVHTMWWVLRDAANGPTAVGGSPDTGPPDALSWQMTWTDPGVQKVEVAIYGSWPEAPWNLLTSMQDWRNDPRVVVLRTTQVVLPQQVAADAAFATSATVDPAQRRAQLQLYLDHIAPPGQPVAPANADTVAAFKAQIAALDDQLAPAAGKQRTPIHAIHLAAGTGQVTPLQILVVSPDAAPLATAAPVPASGPRTWSILDVTDPTNDRWHGTGTGTAASDADAIRAAIDDWKSRVQYPTGVVKLEVPASVAQVTVDVQFESHGNVAADLSEFLSKVGGAVGTIGFLGMLACPVLGLAAFAAVAGTMALTGAALTGAGAAIDVAERHYYRTSSPIGDVMDLLTIATSFFAVGGAIDEGAQILSNGVMRGFVLGGLATGGAQFLVMQGEYIDQLSRALQIQDPKQRLDAVLNILGDAVANDALTLIALNQGVEAYRRMGTLMELRAVEAQLLDPAVRIETGALLPEPAPETGTPTDPTGPESPTVTTGDTATQPGPITQTAAADPELAAGGSSQGKETTASAVPGSDFRGGAQAANPNAVMGHAGTAIESAAGRFSEIQSIEHASAAPIDGRASYGAGAQSQIADTYLITMNDGSSFTVRITSGPIDGDTVARTVVNHTKQGVTRVIRPGATEPVEVDVVGRYVIQLNDTIDPAVVERAISHELDEILAMRELVTTNQPAGADLLKPGGPPEPGAALSPHDRGRLGEIKVLAQGVNQGDPVATRELLALVEELGLRPGGTDTAGASQRQQLVTLALGDDPESLQALAKTWKAYPDLDPALQTELDAVRQGRQQYLDSAAKDQAADQPLHAVPDANPESGKISPQQAVELASHAAAARDAASIKTLADLRARAASGENGGVPRIKDVQIGGGASLAARNPETLLVDARGRWQVDASERIAQTADQLSGLKAAGIGDPSQFAAPDERVPVAAVRYWEDTIAAEGPVIDGTVTGMALDRGNTVITIQPSDGSAPIRVEVDGNVVAATGFPDERIPGGTRDMTPDQAIDKITAALKGIGSDAANQVLAQITDLGLNGVETEPGKRARDLAQLKGLIDGNPGLVPALQAAAPDAYKTMIAGDQWNALTAAHGDRIMLGDMANLESLNAKATDSWVIGGVGGTGISAAEIILEQNSKAHVTMIGNQPPDGLVENDQFRAVVLAHADAPTAAMLAQQYGITVPAGSDGRFSVVFNVVLDSVSFENGQVGLSGTGLSSSGVPPGYEAASNPLGGAGGFISAIGRDGQLLPVLAELADSVAAQGGKVTMEPMYNDEGRYLGYRVSMVDASGIAKQFDVTGAASRFPPWSLFPGSPGELDLAQARFATASDLDAPPESGNFDGGYVSSATQANAYGKAQSQGGTP